MALLFSFADEGSVTSSSDIRAIATELPDLVAPPSRLFKFTPAGRFLKNGKFRFSWPSQLNDPFEARLSLTNGSFTAADLLTARAELGRLGFWGLTDDEVQHLVSPFPAQRFSEKVYKALWPTDEPRLRSAPFESLAQYDAAVAERAVQLVTEAADRLYSMLSLTSIQSEPMWAYYAANGEGLCVEFNPKHPFFLRLAPINYSDTAISVSVNDGIIRIGGKRTGVQNILNRQLDFMPFELLLTKRRSWQHEHEWRLVKFLTEDLTDDTDLILVDIPPEAIVSVTFGYRAKDAEVDRQLSFIEASDKWRHLQVGRQRQTWTSMELEMLR
ncbi:MAG: DUF2971 domain-containing protein [Devosia sp.]